MNEVDVPETNVETKGFLSKVGEGLSNVLKDTKVMQQLLPVLMTAIPPPYDAMVFVALMIVSAVLGVEDDPQKLGYQMNNAEKGLDDPEFGGSMEKYKVYLAACDAKSEHPYCAETFAKLAPEQKLACNVAGLVGMLTELKDSKGFEMSPKALGMLTGAAAGLKWDGKTMGKFADGMKTALAINGSKSYEPFEMAVDGKLEPSQVVKVASSITEGLKSTGSTASVGDVLSAARS